MFGKPIQIEEYLKVLPWVQIYLYKEDSITSITSLKVKEICNRGLKIRRISYVSINVYSMCQTAHPLINLGVLSSTKYVLQRL